MLILGCLLACGGDPQLDPLGEALHEYDAGRSALEQGAPAAPRFAAASADDPDSVALPAWQAQALSQAGDLPGALAVLDEAVRVHPGALLLRYNRAALRARTGDLEGASTDLRILLDAHLLDPAQAGVDRDFDALRADPAYAALVPAPGVEVEGHGEAGAVLLGEPWSLRLTIQAPVDAPIEIEPLGAPCGLLAFERAVEDLGATTAWVALRELVIDFRAVAPGQATLGPWRVGVGEQHVVTDSFPVEVLDLGGQGGTPASAQAARWWLPSGLIGARTPPWAGRVDGRPVVLAAAGTRGGLDTDATPVVLEYREGGQPVWIAGVYPSDVGGHAWVREGTRALLDQDL